MPVGKGGASSLKWSKTIGIGEGEVWGVGRLGEGAVWGGMLFGEVCHLGRYVVWGGLQNAALVLTLILASCKN